ncbi:DUF6282 family protein [Ciceribacter sp. RN22]|uniref:DUF6282 family protein n=1 Tax=Ciceribacter sp. RN22 TaxID=2954932 RepID=UPI002092D9F3|nr:DUF6282 family protein [Ciceribacter sp. RN22]MCO6179428.1 DUF6282 family protein [Ciceribacter sp. RN22]
MKFDIIEIDRVCDGAKKKGNNPFYPEHSGVSSDFGKNTHHISDANFIDIHYHADPDAYLRRHGAIAAGQLYGEFGGWVVLKNHLGCTAAQATEARRAGAPVSGSVVLNEIVGGIDRRVIERSLCQSDTGNGRLIVHLPTVTGRAHKSRLARDLRHSILRDGDRAIQPLTISDDTGRLLPQVMDILRLACDAPIVVSSGHASRGEVYRLIDAALALNVPRLMLNQPANPLTGLSAHDLGEISQASGVFIEQCALTYLLGYQDDADFFAVLRDVRNVIYSSDLGQPSQPDIGEWIDLTRIWFGRAGLSHGRIDDITRNNPLRMLELPS